MGCYCYHPRPPPRPLSRIQLSLIMLIGTHILPVVEWKIAKSIAQVYSGFTNFCTFI